MRRGDVVVVAMQGDHGKPRPAVILQSNLMNETKSIALVPLSSFILDAPRLRLTIEPNDCNGLKNTSQVMVDKLMTPSRDKVGHVIGKLNSKQMTELNKMLIVFLGIG